jgi:hypothetical protein
MKAVYWFSIYSSPHQSSPRDETVSTIHATDTRSALAVVYAIFEFYRPAAAEFG